MKYRWTMAPPQPLLAQALASTLKIPPVLAQCLLNRGLSEAPAIEKFLAPRLKHLSDPFLLPDMAKAVDRLFLARQRAEPLVIFGDYDVDGVASTALLLDVLRPLGWQAHAYLPNRMEEGYGLSQDGIENCLKQHPVTLMLAVDCGSTSVESIAWLGQKGVDVIVLDHHQISSPAPKAAALVNPQAAISNRGQAAGASVGGHSGHPGASSAPHSSCHPPPGGFTELCSTGLAFKFAHALLKRARETGLPGALEFDLKPLLELVALATIADLVPLSGENRMLVAAGLEQLNATRRPGLIALKQVARSPEKLGVHDVGFQLGPRLNAAGRLETAEAALRLLMAQSLDEALPLAQQLDECNRERQKIEKAIVEEVMAALRLKFDAEKDFVIVEGALPWHVGVVGIVASRVLQEFYRPTLIIGGECGRMRGSGRSIGGFDLAAALRECDDLLLRHGGHAMAAGLSLTPENIGPLRERLNAIARRALRPEDLHPPLRLDAEISLGDLHHQSIAGLDKLKPTGIGNPALQFCARQLTHAKPLQRIGASKQHVKMWVADATTAHEAIWWNAGQGSLPVGTFDLAFTPALNEYNGRTTVQLKVLDWRQAAPSP